jgi:hypothetical protein
VHASLPQTKMVRISITNMLGQQVAEVYNGMLGENTLQADLSAQPSGIYMLNIISDNQTFTKRIDIAK